MSCESFIYTQKNALSPELCNEFIDTFNKSESDIKYPGITSRGVDKDLKSSTDITFDPSFKNHPQWEGLLKKLMPILKTHIKNYSNKYFTILDNTTDCTYNLMPDLKITNTFNMQHYKPGEGFYSWHCERTHPNNNHRILTWMFFLNDVTDGGGTQFYYQNHTESAEQGKIVIFSSEWMHAHRGEVSKTQNKYILTGWAQHASIEPQPNILY